VAASFVGRQRQGIHHAPIIAATPRSSTRRPEPAGAGAGPARAPGTRRPPGAPPPRPRPTPGCLAGPSAAVRSSRLAGSVRKVVGVVRADGEARSLLARPRPRGLGDPTRRVVKVLASQSSWPWCGRGSPRWSRGGSNPGPPPCKGGALPAELRPPGRGDARVGAPGLEPGASALSGPRSDRLSYAPRQRRFRAGAARTLARGTLGDGNPRAPPAAPKTEQSHARGRAELVGSWTAAVTAPPRGPRRPRRPLDPPWEGAARGSVPGEPASPARCLTWGGAPKGAIPRKEVIQPQLPLRLPCYDFVPITRPTLDGCLPEGLAHRLQALPAFVT
jgi:hypothetical protein